MIKEVSHLPDAKVIEPFMTELDSDSVSNLSTDRASNFSSARSLSLALSDKAGFRRQSTLFSDASWAKWEKVREYSVDELGDMEQKEKIPYLRQVFQEDAAVTKELKNLIVKVRKERKNVKQAQSSIQKFLHYVEKEEKQYNKRFNGRLNRLKVYNLKSKGAKTNEAQNEIWDTLARLVKKYN